MILIKQSVSLICCSDYKEDFLIKYFYDVFSDDCFLALNSYSKICEILLNKGETLSEYIFYLFVNANNSILVDYIKTRKETLLCALKSDISILSHIANISSERIISFLKEKFSLKNELSFPRFENGDTVISIESILAYKEKFGSSFFEKNKAFLFENNKLQPVEFIDKISLDELKNYKLQQEKVLDNTLCFINGYKAQNALLYGDRGTGKSSTVKAVVNEFAELRIIQVSKKSILGLHSLFDLIKHNPLKFILFFDDITFLEDDDGYAYLKQILEGSVVAMPNNCIIYATTNRRHIIKETESERNGDELHAADARDENMSLADRFGLYITFLAPDKREYLDIVKQIACDRGLNISEERLCALAERFALKKCGRAPRTARQFIDILQSRLELNLDIDTI